MLTSIKKKKILATGIFLIFRQKDNRIGLLMQLVCFLVAGRFIFLITLPSHLMKLLQPDLNFFGGEKTLFYSFTSFA